MTTLILGASSDPSRFSHLAQIKLSQYGHDILLVNPKGGEIEGHPVNTSLQQIQQAIDTVTVYINPKFMPSEIDNIISLKPRRVIFNPGSESRQAAEAFQKQGIKTLEDCTLLMLDGGRY
jgi:uncharacterized protein